MEKQTDIMGGNRKGSIDFHRFNVIDSPTIQGVRHRKFAKGTLQEGR